MGAMIQLRLKDYRGTEILDQLEEQEGLEPDEILPGGIRLYSVNAEGADVHALDTPLDKISPAWRFHVENLDA